MSYHFSILLLVHSFKGDLFKFFSQIHPLKDTRVNTLIKHVRTDRFAVERPRRQHETTHLQRFVFLGFDEEALPAS